MPASSVDIAYRFTDEQYASRTEFAEQLGNHFYEPMWKTVLDYRKKYEIPLDVFQYNRLPFRLVLTPSILAEINSVELTLLQYIRRFSHFQEKEMVSAEKVLQNFQNECLKEELRIIASRNDLPYIDREVSMLLSDKKLPFGSSSPLYTYWEALNYLLNQTNHSIDKQLLRELWVRFSPGNISDSATFYRTIEPKTLESTVFGNDYDGAPVARIPEMMNAIFAFYAADYELSPLLVGTIVYTYLLYVKPLPKYNEEVAWLTMQHIFANAGYGIGVYYASPLQAVVPLQSQWQKLFEEAKKTGDMTYTVLALVKWWRESLVWRLKQLQKLPEPIPFRDEVKIIEKTIEVPVEKTVEVRVEVPVERIVEKVTEVPVERIVERIVEVPKEVIVEKIVEKTVEVRVEVPVERIVEKVTEVPVERIVERIVEVPKEVIVEKIVQKTIEVPVERIVEKIVQIPLETKVEEHSIPLTSGTSESKTIDLNNFNSSSVSWTVQSLIEKFPLIKQSQAEFYLNHRQRGHYYTIDQYREFAKCAYETARTSMDFLASINLYQKTKIKNKFVYTPHP